MRPTCTFCARKHLAQAIILLGETANGYPEHLWLAVGHLAEASDELGAFPALAAEIRGYRKQLELAAPTALPPLPLMEMIGRLGKLDVPSPHPNEYAIVGRPDHSKRLDTGVMFADPRPATFKIADSLDPDYAVLRAQVPTTLAIGIAANEPPSRVGHHMAAGGMTPIPVPPHVRSAIAAAEAAYEKGAPFARPAPVAQPERCLDCEDKAHLRNLAQQLADDKTSYRGRLVILTTLGNFARSYSLASVVLEQAHAAAIAGYRVIIMVYRGCDMTQCPPLPPEISVLPVVPPLHWKLDVVDTDKAQELTIAMIEWFQVLTAGVDSLHIITHDILFQAHFVTFAAAIHNFSTPEPARTPSHPEAYRNISRSKLRWWHMAHSSVGARPTITAIPGTPGHGAVDPLHWRHTLPFGHRLILLNYADVRFFGSYYHDEHDQPLIPPTGPIVVGGNSRIHVLKNPRDIRPYLNMGVNAAMLTSRYRLHLVDVFMLYPLSLDRVEEKGVRNVLRLLGAMKRMGSTVRLVIAAAHANGNDQKAMWVQEQARAAGLVTHGAMKSRSGMEPTPAGPISVPAQDYPDDELEVILTSEAILDPAVKTHGLPPEDISALFQVSNLFIFPTISEAGPLVLLEAALAGCTLVLNQSLRCLRDYIDPTSAVWVPWGSIKEPGHAPSERDGTDAPGWAHGMPVPPPEIDQLARVVMHRMGLNTGQVLKRRIMQEHCLETYGERLVDLLETGGVAFTGILLNITNTASLTTEEGEARIDAAVADSAALRREYDEQTPPGWNEDHPPREPA